MVGTDYMVRLQAPNERIWKLQILSDEPYKSEPTERGFLIHVLTKLIIRDSTDDVGESYVASGKHGESPNLIHPTNELDTSEGWVVGVKGVPTKKLALRLGEEPPGIWRASRWEEITEEEEENASRKKEEDALKHNPFYTEIVGRLQRLLTDPQLACTLPMGIVSLILYRLPVKSVLRCTSVCKLWLHEISDPYFVKCHLGHSSKNPFSHKILYRNSNEPRRVLKLSNVYEVLHKSDSYSELGHDLISEYGKFVGSCNGLLCMASVRYEKLVIWNPSTRKWNGIPCSGHEAGNGYYLACGFGFDSSSDDYKIVELFCHVEGVKTKTISSIYSLRNEKWNKSVVFPEDLQFLDYSKFSNGVLYWVTSGSTGWVMVSFDLATETCGEVVKLPNDEDYMSMTLGLLREKLCVLCDYNESRFDLWEMTACKVEDSWTRLISISYTSDPETYQFYVPLYVSVDNKLLLQFGSTLIVYDLMEIVDSEILNLECDEASIFVESLVSPNPSANIKTLATQS